MKNLKYTNIFLLYVSLCKEASQIYKQTEQFKIGKEQQWLNKKYLFDSIWKTQEYQVHVCEICHYVRTNELAH